MEEKRGGARGQGGQRKHALAPVPSRYRKTTDGLINDVVEALVRPPARTQARLR